MASSVGLNTKPIGLGAGVPPWIDARARELVPTLHERSLHLSNATDLMRTAVSEVVRWLDDPEFMVERRLDLVELFCGHGGITTTCLFSGLQAVGFDRLRWGRAKGDQSSKCCSLGRGRRLQHGKRTQQNHRGGPSSVHPKRIQKPSKSHPKAIQKSSNLHPIHIQYIARQLWQEM